MNRAVIIAALLVSAAILYSSVQTAASFRQTQEDMERYIACQQDAMLFEEGSNYLTDQSRCFAMTGKKEYVFNFVEEIEVTRRRERTRDDAAYFRMEEDSLRYLDQALQHSNELADVEMYAMRLMIEALGYDVGEFPERIQAVALAPEDAALSAEEMRAAAVDRLFNEDYTDSKGRIYENVEKSIIALMEDTREQMIRSTGRLDALLVRQQLLVAALLVTLVVIVLLTAGLIIRPLQRNIHRVEARDSMDESGSNEMRRLARVYNRLLAENIEKHEELSYTATHDALTGVRNRAAYEEDCRRVDRSAIGVLIVDVDDFKHFNDSFGHEMGDRVLRRVAQVLMASFRSEDHVSRIGGDEFCVIMMHAQSSLADLVREKVARMNELLASGAEDLPPISLSVGVAFGDSVEEGVDIFKAADTALYRVKGAGRNGCEVY